MPIRLICLDADDTLWGHESYFQASYRRFVDLLAPFAGASRSEERLVEIENRNLHLYGYGVKGFTLLMLETALEIMGDELTAAATRPILEIGRDLMRHPIDLLEGVVEALGPLEQRGALVIVTKGDLFHQESKLAASGLGDRFSESKSSAKRTPRPIGAYSRVTAPVPRRRAGNSPRSDILPALEAGAWAVHIPHEFEWAHERAETPDGEQRFARLRSLQELPG